MVNIPQIQVDLYKFISDNKWSTTPVTLDFPTGMTEDEGIETRKDTFQFTLQNSRLVGANTFDNRLGLANQDALPIRMKDKFLMYAWYGTKPTNLNSSLIMDGTVNELSYQGGEKDSLVTIKGANATEEMLSTMVPSSFSKDIDQFNVAEVITKIIKRVNSLNRGKKMAAWLTTEKKRWFPSKDDFAIDNTNGILGSVQAVKADGTAFDDITYAENWKSAYMQVETLSRSDYTGDDDGGVYIFGFKPFLDPVSGERFNQFFWNNKKVGLSGSITEGVDFYPVTMRRGTWDVYNAAIINAGEDLYSAGIITLAYNAVSMGKLGAKWKYLPLTNKFSGLYDTERSRGAVLGSNFGIDRFPDTYDWVFPYAEVDINGKVVVDPGVATNDSEFNTILRYKASDDARKQGLSIVNQFGEARYKSEGELELGSNNYVLGDLYEIIAPSYGWDGTTTNPSKKLRLVDARHTFNQSGWTTTIFYEEDEKVISDRVNA